MNRLTIPISDENSDAIGYAGLVQLTIVDEVHMTALDVDLAIAKVCSVIVGTRVVQMPSQSTGLRMNLMAKSVDAVPTLVANTVDVLCHQRCGASADLVCLPHLSDETKQTTDATLVHKTNMSYSYSSEDEGPCAETINDGCVDGDMIDHMQSVTKLGVTSHQLVRISNRLLVQDGCIGHRMQSEPTESAVHVVDYGTVTAFETDGFGYLPSSSYGSVESNIGNLNLKFVVGEDIFVPTQLVQGRSSSVIDVDTIHIASGYTTDQSDGTTDKGTKVLITFVLESKCTHPYSGGDESPSSGGVGNKMECSQEHSGWLGVSAKECDKIITARNDGSDVADQTFEGLAAQYRIGNVVNNVSTQKSSNQCNGKTTTLLVGNIHPLQCFGIEIIGAIRVRGVRMISNPHQRNLILLVGIIEDKASGAEDVSRSEYSCLSNDVEPSTHICTTVIVEAGRIQQNCKDHDNRNKCAGDTVTDSTNCGVNPYKVIEAISRKGLHVVADVVEQKAIDGKASAGWHVEFGSIGIDGSSPIVMHMVEGGIVANSLAILDTKQIHS